MLSCSDGIIMRKESSVSICADRAFKFVDPKRVKIGKSEMPGESQMPGYRVRSRFSGSLSKTITFRVIGPSELFPLAQMNAVTSATVG